MLHIMVFVRSTAPTSVMHWQALLTKMPSSVLLTPLYGLKLQDEMMSHSARQSRLTSHIGVLSMAGPQAELGLQGPNC